MKKGLLLIPTLLTIVTSCGAVQMLDDTTDAINQNREAVEMSTQVIYQNANTIQGSNRAIDENRRRLEELSKS